MSQVIYSCLSPLLSAQRVYLESQEEEEQTNGGLELVRLPPFVVSQLLDELVTASVEDIVRSHPRIGARQGHGHAVYAPVSDEKEERCGVIVFFESECAAGNGEQLPPVSMRVQRAWLIRDGEALPTSPGSNRTLPSQRRHPRQPARRRSRVRA